jgi:hypothetical protein
MCAPSTCEDGRKNGAETGLDCGGGTCPPCAGDQGCLDGSDCVSLLCVMELCTTSACNDRVQNQDETSVDCGGAVCLGCPDGLACVLDIDCAGMRCVDGGCVSCMDRVRDAEETDVDCGGGLCPACADLSTCVINEDCVSNRCLAGTCVSCTDRTMNAEETDVDCGGAICGACNNGLMCLSGTDCLSGDCNASNLCQGIADSCANPAILTTGLNTVGWVAMSNDYLTVRPACSASTLTGPDIVMQYTATLNGYLSYDIVKPINTRWALVISDGTCGDVTAQLDCNGEYTAAYMRGQIPVTAGTTYRFYLADTTSGTLPLTNPLSITLTEIVPPCMPGVGGMVGDTVTRLPTSGFTFLSEYFMAADASPTGWVYVGGSSDMWRVPKAGGVGESIELLGGFTTTRLGYDMALAGSDIFTVETTTIPSANALFRVSRDGGTTWVAGAEDYATFSPTPNDDFRGSAGYGGNLYLITQEITTTSNTEIWSVPLGASTVPVTGTRLGTIPFLDCTGLAADSTYLYTACENFDEIVRIDRATMATTVIANTINLSTTRSALAADDLDSDGVADVIYFNTGGHEAFFVCGWTATSMGFAARLASWGVTATSNFGLAFDESTNTLYGWDDVTRELIQIR